MAQSLQQVELEGCRRLEEALPSGSKACRRLEKAFASRFGRLAEGLKRLEEAVLKPFGGFGTYKPQLESAL